MGPRGCSDRTGIEGLGGTREKRRGQLLVPLAQCADQLRGSLPGKRRRSLSPCTTSPFPRPLTLPCLLTLVERFYPLSPMRSSLQLLFKILLLWPLPAVTFLSYKLGSCSWDLLRLGVRHSQDVRVTSQPSACGMNRRVQRERRG